ncbi:MAG: class I SAM-dependent methyltransferase [Leptolyngbyaceae cyanobacterium SM2_5_2]|nr:class I SAM-dependent methyltransferase [Leptolyngbyaceae cyanobacterium SM2_5_2]
MSDFLNRWPLPNNWESAAGVINFEARGIQPYQAVEGQSARPTLLKALECYGQDLAPLPKLAVDLGCGDGCDTVELLSQGWRVLAIDGAPETIQRLRQRSDIDRTYLETRVQGLEDLTLPPGVSLINASFCLPFCPPAHFPDLWEEIVTALAAGGRFCGQLFGHQDTLAILQDVTLHTRQQVEDLLQPFKIELLDEESHPNNTAPGEKRHWYLFNIVACKR